MKQRKRTEVIIALEYAQQLIKAMAEGEGITDECTKKYREIEDVNHTSSNFSKWMGEVSNNYKDTGYFFAHAQYFITRTLREAQNTNVSTEHLENCMMKIHRNLMQVNKTSAGGKKQLIRDNWSMFSKAAKIDPYIFADASTHPDMIKQGGGNGIINDI